MKLFWSASRPNSRLRAASTGAGGCIGMIVDTEDGVDGGAIVGEPPPVLLGRGRLAGALAELALDCKSSWSKVRRGPACRPHEVFDRGRSPPRFHSALEAIGWFVDPGPFSGLGVAHGNLRRQSPRIPVQSVFARSPVGPDPLQLRSTVRSVHSSCMAISWLV